MNEGHLQERYDINVSMPLIHTYIHTSCVYEGFLHHLILTPSETNLVVHRTSARTDICGFVVQNDYLTQVRIVNWLDLILACSFKIIKL
ncbi:hypothetical protein Mp_3g12250 [Marchantia polymorpha subsp. ruderalis]|uniref:Uncharacterized protein n=2 Tax=Marchantia polymorpha TaxID=3197 RepID=A0AAF6B009_MARPO|nr:hypothetical protein MARPO_0050s0030 [Marchantia polymorpha]BBN05343.1 hypothetical protein Mp_3g12250 [Marchantia polymorpha subsp. ruderalis]|eukprot:PTQ38564.1 hypothetical protein MARPO_0050s0030 [Marchantia polymorpha]